MVSLPNIVLILADDHGYGDVSVHDGPHIQTPHIDRMLRMVSDSPNFMQTLQFVHPVELLL